MDQFVAAYKDALSKYAQFSGRLSVGGYWRFVAVNIVAWIVFVILAQIASALIFLAVIYWLAILIPSIAAAVRRMHDTGKSGVMLLVGIIPLVGLIVIFWLASAGNPGGNEYGAPTA